MTEHLGDAVHVWLCRDDGGHSPQELERCIAVLDEAERARWQRYLFETSRQLFVLAHGFLRFTLSRYADVEPRDWRFVSGEHGRPELAGPGAGDLRFNLSHTDGLIAVQVNRSIDCGVDVEPRRRKINVDALSQRVFSPAERADVMSRVGTEQNQRFFEYWTLKESYIKARGMGMALPLRKFAFRVGDPVTIEFDPELQDDPAHWQFHLAPADSRHQLAVAVRRGNAADREIVVRSAGPTGS